MTTTAATADANALEVVARARPDLIGIDRALAEGQIGRSGWTVLGAAPSPIRGGSGALEGFVHAEWARESAR